ncbi:MAG TPA: hypothetical protein VL286_01995 [Rhizomicrobium sp.]|jgi:hypothetical protein|nr:hypothetical protein [Rhizomicrobium sp.]
MSDYKSRDDLPFRRDFAARVLQEADRISARRRRVAGAGVLAAVAAVTGAFAFGIWSMVTAREPMPPMNSPAVANADAETIASLDSAQTEPLDYMFPDAAPLAQFADRYSTAATGGATARQNILFAEDAAGDGTR